VTRIRTLIRRYVWHVVFGGVVGAASFELWQYALPDGVREWLVCVVAVGFVLVVEFAVGEARHRRARPTRPRRRVHARTTPAQPSKGGVAS